MKTFKDNADRTWTVQVNVDAIKRVRDLAGLDLLSAVDAALLEKLASDPVLLCDVVYAVCKQEADANGVDPGPLTLRELVWMAQAAGRAAWAHTSAILAMIANANRDPKKKPTPFRPDDFSPYGGKRARSGIRLEAGNIELLRTVFVDAPAGQAGQARRRKP